jgi:hypothetical protein
MSGPQKQSGVPGLTQAIADACEAFGADIVEEIRSEIATSYPPASSPGEPPHRRSGNLIASSGHSVISEVSASRVELTIYNTAPYAVFLRDGTGRMAARDFMGDERLDEYMPRFADAVVGALQAKFS